MGISHHLLLAPSGLKLFELARCALALPYHRVVLLAPSGQHDPLLADLSARLDGDAMGRIELLEGQPWALDFGLTGQEYRSLCSRVRWVHHLWAPSPGSSQADAERHGVEAARESLEFASRCANLERLVFHSTIRVSGDRSGPVLETELQAGQKFVEASNAAMATAELMLRRQAGKLPTVVLRTSPLVGELGGPRGSGVDSLVLMVLLCLSSPQDFSSFLPRWGDYPLHVTPVDYWAAAGWALSTLPDVLGRTFHITDPAPLSLRAIFNRCTTAREQLLREGFSMPPLTQVLKRTDELSQKPGSSQLLRRPWELMQAAPRDVQYDTREAQAALGPVGIVCPTLDSYFEEFVRKIAIAIGALPPRAAATRSP